MQFNLFTMEKKHTYKDIEFTAQNILPASTKGENTKATLLSAKCSSSKLTKSRKQLVKEKIDTLYSNIVDNGIKSELKAKYKANRSEVRKEERKQFRVTQRKVNR